MTSVVVIFARGSGAVADRLYSQTVMAVWSDCGTVDGKCGAIVLSCSVGRVGGCMSDAAAMDVDASEIQSSWTDSMMSDGRAGCCMTGGADRSAFYPYGV